MRLDQIQTLPITPAVLTPFQATVAALGSEGFYRTLSNALEEFVHVDRLYLIEGSAKNAPLIARAEPGKPHVAGATYVDQYLPSDPLQRAIEALSDERMIFRLCVSPADIVVHSYRRMLERAGVVARVSFIRMLGRAGWRCMTVVRRRQSGDFSEEELCGLGDLYRLLMPLVDRHRALVGEIVEDRAVRIEELERRFAERFPALTPRERQVCARAAIGISVEGAALDLGIGAASILTYRRRAYLRLNVSSAYELARLVLR